MTSFVSPHFEIELTASVYENSMQFPKQDATNSCQVRVEISEYEFYIAELWEYHVIPWGEGDYELRLWMKQCDSAICDTLNGAPDPFFKDTRIIYNEAPNLVQSFRLDAIKNAQFDRFIFGFTAAAGADQIDASIGNFNLSFIRPGDPIITP